jgi:hypothetical protein
LPRLAEQLLAAQNAGVLRVFFGIAGTWLNEELFLIFYAFCTIILEWGTLKH